MGADGFCNALISLIEALSSTFKTSSAALNIGNALFNSFSHSSLIVCASSEATLAISSSLPTSSLTLWAASFVQQLHAFS